MTQIYFIKFGEIQLVNSCKSKKDKKTTNMVVAKISSNEMVGEQSLLATINSTEDDKWKSDVISCTEACVFVLHKTHFKFIQHSKGTNTMQVLQNVASSKNKLRRERKNQIQILNETNQGDIRQFEADLYTRTRGLTLNKIGHANLSTNFLMSSRYPPPPGHIHLHHL